MILGIDPGSKGYICFGEGLWIPVPLTPGANLAIFRSLGNATSCYLEQVQPWKRDTPTTAWGLSRSYHQILMALTAAEVKVNLVRPQVWQKHFDLIGKEKGAAVELVRKKHSDCPKEAADSILIWEYGRCMT